HRTLLISEPSYDRFHRVAIGCISIMESFLNMSSLLLMPVHHFWCKNSEGQDSGLFLDNHGWIFPTPHQLPPFLGLQV
ncbi:hypothetical protein, partial [Glaesserella parasuis]